MAGSFTVNGGNTTITFTQTAPTAKMLAIITAAAHGLWNKGIGNHGTDAAPIVFESLTNQQKLDIVDVFYKKITIELASAFMVTTSINSATVAATDDANTNLNF